ncbi:MAG TPA: methyl-accepting chemotaxis protein [Thermoanaerobaculia bacterium]
MLLSEQQSGRWLRAGLRAKFIAAFFVQTLVIAVGILLVHQWLVRRAMVRQMVTEARSIVRSVESSSAYSVMFRVQPELQAVVTDLRNNPSVLYADFIDGNGARLAATHPQPPAQMQAAPRARLDGTEVGPGNYLFVVPFQEKDQVRPIGYFRLLADDNEADRASDELRWWNVVVTLAALGFALIMALFISKWITHPVLALAGSVQQISKGDLTQQIVAESQDEIGTLAEVFNAMSKNLERTIRSVVQSQAKLKSVVETVDSRSRTVIDRVDEQRAIIDETYQSVDKLNNGVRKITDNVEALSASSEETSSSMLEMVASMEEVSRHTDTLWGSVEETASATHQMVSSINEVDQNVVYLTNFVTDTSSSMVEMSASIAQVETNAARSYDLNLAVADAAESGMKAVRETIEGMEQIRQSVINSNAVVSRLGERSAAIGRILNVIEDVAEQTNLLALNAAILAAQAGEYGKGFSVVAAEIRELSERTASSTRDIANLIGAVQDEVKNALHTMSDGSRLVESGVSLSHEAGKALTRILDSATKASGMGKEIAGATREQAAGSETVTRAVERLQELVKQISSATAQQAAGSNHIMKAVESMREVTKYVRQAMVEQKSGSGMISSAAERMIEMIHEIFQVAANQAAESEKIVSTMEQVRTIADGNRLSAAEMSEAITLLNDAIRSLDEEVRKFRVH